MSVTHTRAFRDAWLSWRNNMVSGPEPLFSRGHDWRPAPLEPNLLRRAAPYLYGMRLVVKVNTAGEPYMYALEWRRGLVYKE